jgi:hypothetical protein
MGCWNGTCFLSNISIRSGDRIKLQLLMPAGGKESSDYIDLEHYDVNCDPRDINGITYVCDELIPFTPAITGKYNDYGSIEEVVKDDSLVFLKKYIGELVSRGEILSLQSVDKWLDRNRDDKDAPKGKDATIPVNVNNIDEFIDMVERGSIIVKSCFGGWRRLRFVMMHEDIYQSALSSVGKWKDWHGKNIVNSQKTKQKQIISFYTTGTLPVDDDSSDSQKALSKMLIDTVEDISEKMTDKDKEKAEKALHSMKSMFAGEILWEDFRYSENRIWCRGYLSDFCSDSKNKKNLAGAVAAAFENININNYISKLRKPWALTGGCGSQDDNETDVAAHCKMITKFVVAYNKELKKRYEE